jgi:hypothetical protein
MRYTEKKMSGVVLKLDFEKAYDKVNLDFLFQTLRMKGFQQNDTLGRYFQTKKGLRQGDPLSPLLFNLAVDMVSLLISRAKDNDQINGLVPHLIEGGISILQYADDTILFIENDLEQAKI